MLRFWCLSTCRIGFQPTQWKLSHNHAYYTTSKSSSIVVPQTRKKNEVGWSWLEDGPTGKPSPKDSQPVCSCSLECCLQGLNPHMARVQYDWWILGPVTSVTLTSRVHMRSLHSSPSNTFQATFVPCHRFATSSAELPNAEVFGAAVGGWKAPLDAIEVVRTKKSLSEIVLMQRYCKTETIFSAPLHICSRRHCALSSMATSYRIDSSLLCLPSCLLSLLSSLNLTGLACEQPQPQQQQTRWLGRLRTRRIARRPTMPKRLSNTFDLKNVQTDFQQIFFLQRLCWLSCLSPGSCLSEIIRNRPKSSEIVRNRLLNFWVFPVWVLGLRGKLSRPCCKTLHSPPRNSQPTHCTVFQLNLPRQYIFELHTVDFVDNTNP